MGEGEGVERSLPPEVVHLPGGPGWGSVGWGGVCGCGGPGGEGARGVQQVSSERRAPTPADPSWSSMWVGIGARPSLPPPSAGAHA